MSENEFETTSLWEYFDRYRKSSGAGSADNELEVNRTALLVKCFFDFTNSTNKNAESSQSLAKKVLWLNRILVSATVIGTIIAGFNFFVPNSPTTP